MVLKFSDVVLKAAKAVAPECKANIIFISSEVSDDISNFVGEPEIFTKEWMGYDPPSKGAICLTIALERNGGTVTDLDVEFIRSKKFTMDEIESLSHELEKWCKSYLSV